MWGSGEYHNYLDGAGHVAIVEEIKSDGSGKVTAEYDGNIEDAWNIKYITLINEGSIRPYHVSNDRENAKPRGWVSKSQIKKIFD